MSDDTRIQFPCDYPIRIIGEQAPTGAAAFRATVLDVVRAHVAIVHEASVSVRESREGTYCSVGVTIVATGEAELETLHRALLAVPAVRMVL